MSRKSIYKRRAEKFIKQQHKKKTQMIKVDNRTWIEIDEDDPRYKK